MCLARPKGYGGRFQARSTSTPIRPSFDYEQEWRNRAYGGDEKQRRAEERRQQAALRAQGTTSSSSDLCSRGWGQTNERRSGLPLSKIATQSSNDRASWNDGAWGIRQCWWMTESNDPRPLWRGSSAITDADLRNKASAAERCQHPGKYVPTAFGSDGHGEADSMDPGKKPQLRIVKLAFDAAAYGEGCLSLVPDELLTHTGHEQNGWIKGRRYPPRPVTGSGAAQEGWYPADFTRPWPELANESVDSLHAAAVVDERPEAAAGKPRKTLQVGVAVGSFDGLQYGKDYMSLDVGDIVEHDGVEDGGWLLGRCINCGNGEVLKHGWYPQGFTQSLPAAAPMAACPPETAVLRSLGPVKHALGQRPQGDSAIDWPAILAWARLMSSSAQAAEPEGESPGTYECTPQQSACSLGWKLVEECRWERVVDHHAAAVAPALVGGHNVGMVASAGAGALECAAAVEELAEEPDAEQPPAPAA